jgi:hypothetical protein
MIWLFRVRDNLPGLAMVLPKATDYLQFAVSVRSHAVENHRKGNIGH